MDTPKIESKQTRQTMGCLMELSSIKKIIRTLGLENPLGLAPKVKPGIHQIKYLLAGLLLRPVWSILFSVFRAGGRANAYFSSH